MTWGLSETGAAGPAGNSYGDPAGLTCMGIASPVTATRKLETNISDRRGNIWSFAAATLAFFIIVLETVPHIVN